MKVGVLQFFSWPGRHGPLEEVYSPRARAHRDHGQVGLRCRVAGRAPLHDLQRLPVGAHAGRAGGGAHQAAAHRHGGVAGGALPSAAARRRSGAARHAVGRPRQLGRRAWLCPFGVPRLRRAAGTECRALPRGRRDRPEGLDRGALHLQGRAFPVRRHRGAAQAACSSRIRRPGWPRRRRRRSNGRRAAAFRFSWTRTPR